MFTFTPLTLLILLSTTVALAAPSPAPLTPSKCIFDCAQMDDFGGQLVPTGLAGESSFTCTYAGGEHEPGEEMSCEYDLAEGYLIDDETGMCPWVAKRCVGPQYEPISTSADM